MSLLEAFCYIKTSKIYYLYYNISTLGVIVSGASLLLLIIIDFIAICSERNKRVKYSKADRLISLNVLKVTTSEVREWKEKKSKVFVLVDNYVVDVEKYLDNHSGGRNTLADSLYGDVTRYLTGSVPFNSKFQAIDHRYSTCLYAIRTLAIAEIEDDHKIIIDDSKSVYINEECQLVGGRQTAGATSEFTFQSFRDNIKFARFLPGFSWMGKHFSITGKSQNKCRLYSLCLAGNKTIHEKHQVLLSNVIKLENKESINSPQLTKNDYYSNELQLYVKRYDTQGAFSFSLHTDKIPSNDYIIKGPLGLGLDLNESTLDGTYALMSAGTGVYCFLDFASFAIRLMVNKISKTHNCLTNNLSDQESFDKVDLSFKLILCITFPNEANAYWHDIFTEANRLDSQYNLGIFRYFPRISSQEPRWTSSQYKKIFTNESSLKRVLLCGPADYLDSVKSILVNENLAHESIISLV